MGVIDNSNMLMDLYKTPVHARKWYMWLFGYALDLSVCNAWVLYKSDCKALGERPMALNFFRLDISSVACCQNAMVSRVTRASPMGVMPVPRRGQRTPPPPIQLWYDTSKLHMPTFVVNHQTCKHCSTKTDVHRSRWMCEVCQVALCLSDARNCFKAFHTPPSYAKQLPSTSAMSP